MAPPPDERYRRRALTWLVVTTVAYLVQMGAQIFETVTVVPRWAADPPASLALLRGEHGLDFQAFWITVHTVHELTFVGAVAACWRLPRTRNALLAILAAHVAVRVWTLVYFAPEIIAFQRDPLPATATPDLIARVEAWQELNLVRVGLFLACCLALLPLVRHLARRVPAAPAAVAVAA